MSGRHDGAPHHVTTERRRRRRSYRCEMGGCQHEHPFDTIQVNICGPRPERVHGVQGRRAQSTRSDARLYGALTGAQGEQVQTAVREGLRQAVEEHAVALVES